MMIIWSKRMVALALLISTSLLIWISGFDSEWYSVHQHLNLFSAQHRGTPDRANQRDPRSVVGAHVGRSVDRTDRYSHGNQSLSSEQLIFHVNHENICDTHVSLLVVVCSAVQSFGLRDAIRTTWGSVSQKPLLYVKVLFLLGLPAEEHSHLQMDINRESRKYGDIIQGNFIDDYKNLSLKSTALLRWTSTYCKRAEYILKTDGDMFINVPVLLQELTKMRARKFIMGKVIKSAKPVRDRRSKWFTPYAVFKGRYYPKYVSGTAYVFSGDILNPLLQATDSTKLFWLEDIYITGICAKKVGALIIDNNKFTYFKRKQDPCVYKQIITGHKMAPSELEEVWKAIHRVDLICPGNRLYVDDMVQVGKNH